MDSEKEIRKILASHNVQCGRYDELVNALVKFHREHEDEQWRRF